MELGKEGGPMVKSPLTSNNALYFNFLRARKRWRTTRTGWSSPMPRNNFFGTNAWILYGHDQDFYAISSRRPWAGSHAHHIRRNIWAIGRRVR